MIHNKGIQLQDIALTWPDGTVLFENLSLDLGHGKTGIVGNNGSGKSTLLKIAAGTIEPSSGSVTSRGPVALHDQNFDDLNSATIAEYFRVSEVWAANQRATAGMATQADLDIADWEMEQRILDLLEKFGIPEPDLSRVMASFSGGQKVKASLAKMSHSKADILLFDEPTNNMDRDGRRCLIDLIEHHRGPVIVVSHDRELLRRMDQIVEVEAREVSIYGGNWDDYRAQKDVELSSLEKALQNSQSTLKRVDQQAQRAKEQKDRRDARGKKAGKSGSQSRILVGKQAERAENSGAKLNTTLDAVRGQAVSLAAELGRKLSRADALNLALPNSGLPANKKVLEFAEVSVGYTHGVSVIDGLSLTLTGSARVSIAGPNGCGKSTALKLAARQISPWQGKVSGSSSHAYFDQEARMLDLESSIAENFRRLHPELSENDCRAALARFGFRAGAALDCAGQLSGGERLRAALACALCGSNCPELLILDEPTNHLDIRSTHILERALGDYDGALLIVSHDTSFLEAIKPSQTIELG